MTNEMTIPVTKVSKNYYGWGANTTYVLKDNRVLEISTSKSSSGKVVTYAQAYEINNSNGYSSKSFTMFQDYNKTIVSVTVSRVTEKSISEAHSNALLGIDVIIAEAKTFYSIED